MAKEYLVSGGPKMPPVHPGEILREDVIPEMAITVSEFARKIGVSRQILHRILVETQGITPEMALRVGRFLGNGPELWLAMQQKYDLWKAQEHLIGILEDIPVCQVELGLLN
jgi:antitoxin HigA-1